MRSVTGWFPIRPACACPRRRGRSGVWLDANGRRMPVGARVPRLWKKTGGITAVAEARSAARGECVVRARVGPCAAVRAPREVAGSCGHNTRGRGGWLPGRAWHAQPSKRSACRCAGAPIRDGEPKRQGRPGFIRMVRGILMV